MAEAAKARPCNCFQRHDQQRSRMPCTHGRTHGSIRSHGNRKLFQQPTNQRHTIPCPCHLLHWQAAAQCQPGDPQVKPMAGLLQLATTAQCHTTAVHIIHTLPPALQLVTKSCQHPRTSEIRHLWQLLPTAKPATKRTNTPGDRACVTDCQQRAGECAVK